MSFSQVVMLSGMVGSRGFALGQGTVGALCKKSSFQIGSRALSSTVYAWGEGTSGQLGLGAVKMNRSSFGGDKKHVGQTPRRLPSSKDLDFRKLAMGNTFTLGVTNAGFLYGWGKFWGLGNKGELDVLEPTALSLEPKFKSVSAGKFHGAAIDKAGQVYTFGQYANKGDKGGFFSFLSTAPEGGWLGHGDDHDCDTPRMIESFKEYGAAARDVVCGDMHTLILTDDGEVLSCGVGESGRLGTGDTDILSTPTSIEALIHETVVDIAAGANSSYALTDTGKLYAWGMNQRGQLGISDSFLDPNSVEVFPAEVDQSELHGDIIHKVTACGSRAAVLTLSGQVYVWGRALMPTPHRLVLDNYYESMGLKADGSDDPVVDLVFGGDSRFYSLAMVLRSGRMLTVGDAGSSLLARPGVMGKQEAGLVEAFMPKPKGALPMVTQVFGGRGQHMACLVDSSQKVEI
jgi:hypothetical protein